MAFGLPSRQEESSRHRPVALELHEYLRASGCEVTGPFWEGPFKIDAVTASISFCLMPEDAYFKKPGDFSEEKLELCHERF